MNPSALINGKFADSLPVTDRGLNYGDGVFETIAVCEGRLLCWHEHLIRLAEGCRRLDLPCPDMTVLQAEARRLVADTQRAILKIILTRGAGGRGYTPDPAARGNRVLSLHEWPDYPPDYRQHGVRLRLCHQRLAVNPALAGIKHLNRLEQILARAEWTDPDIAEGLMLNHEGQLIEGTMSNLFLRCGDTLFTPDVAQSGIAGVIRGRVLAAARELDQEIIIAPLDLHDLKAADELFLCNSIIGIWPVRAVGDKIYEPGPASRAIRDHLLIHDCISPD